MQDLESLSQAPKELTSPISRDLSDQFYLFLTIIANKKDQTKGEILNKNEQMVLQVLCLALLLFLDKRRIYNSLLLDKSVFSS